MAHQVALETFGLSKSYGGVHAVRDVSVRLRPGEVHGLLGRNGAGKTTLLRMLLGLTAPSGGDIRLLGRAAGTAAGPAEGGVAGFVDAPKLYPYLSGRRNLRLLARLDDAAPGGPAAPDHVEEVLGRAGLGNAADAKVAGYSAGMRQRLGFASVLLRAPALLLLDEPTSSLDPAGARDLREHVRAIAAAGTAVLLSSHDLREVEDLCGSLTIVDHGQVVFSGTLEELRELVPAAVHGLSTSDDERAKTIAAAHEDVQLDLSEDDGRLDVCASEAARDRFVVALGQAGIAVRALERRDRSLESLFLRLTADAARRDGAPSSAPAPASARGTPPAPAEAHPRASSLRGVALVASAELSKLTAQVKVWATLGACLLGPLAFVAALKLQSTLPEDTLFGRGAKASGFAVPLVILGFAGAWALPALTSIVSGDLFASEDRFGTWPTLLTRSRTRGELFAGKTLAGLLFALAAVTVLAFGASAAGVLFIGRQPLLSLSGLLLSPGNAAGLVALAWASVLPPVFGFTGLAILLSVATRSSAAGIGLPVLAGLAMQLASLVNGPDVLRRALLTTPFGAWHGLFTDPAFHRPLLEGSAVSFLYFAAAITGAYVLFRRRDLGS